MSVLVHFMCALPASRIHLQSSELPEHRGSPSLHPNYLGSSLHQDYLDSRLICLLPTASRYPCECRFVHLWRDSATPGGTSCRRWWNRLQYIYCFWNYTCGICWDQVRQLYSHFFVYIVQQYNTCVANHFNLGVDSGNVIMCCSYLQFSIHTWYLSLYS